MGLGSYLDSYVVVMSLVSDEGAMRRGLGRLLNGERD